MRRTLFSLFVSMLWLGSMTTAAFAQAAGAKVDDISGAWILIELFPDETHAHRISLQVADANESSANESSANESS